MKPFQPHKFDDNVHPLVRQLFTAMNARHVNKRWMAKKAGVNYTSMGDWQYRGYRPRLANIEACLNVLGYELAIVPKKTVDTGKARV